jgi:hypothetical protein
MTSLSRSVELPAGASSAADITAETAFFRYSLAAIIVLGWLVYLPALDAPFLFDDLGLIVRNDYGVIDNLWPWGPLPDGGRWFGTWTLQLSYAIHGLNLFGWHITNVAIHVAAGCLLFGLVACCLNRRGIPPWLAAHRHWLAIATALIWVVHPLQTQAVTYIIQRYESLMGLFYLLTIYCLVRGDASNRPWIWYTGSIVACWAGAATKEVMISAPVVALLVDRAFLTDSWREIWRRRWGLYLGLFAAVGWLVYVSYGGLVGKRSPSAGFGLESLSSWEYLRSQPAVLIHYLRLVFWPDVLVFDYGWPIETNPWRIYGLGFVIVLLLGASLWAVWRAPRIGVLGLAFFLILAPTSSIVPIMDLAFEHRMYLPSACVILLALVAAVPGVSCTIGEQRKQEQILWVAATIAITLLAGRTALRNVEYRDPIRMWERMIAIHPHPRTMGFLAKLYMNAGRYDESVDLLQRLLALAPDHYEGWNHMAKLYFAKRDYPRASQYCREAIKRDPKGVSALLTLGRSEMFQGNYTLALEASRAALACAPNAVAPRQQVAWLLATVPVDHLRDGAAALQLLEGIGAGSKSINLEWELVRAAALAEVGRYDDAAAGLDRVVRAIKASGRNADRDILDQLERYRDHQPWRLKPTAQEKPKNSVVPAEIAPPNAN